jgi:hypothetical protein
LDTRQATFLADIAYKFVFYATDDNTSNYITHPFRFSLAQRGFGSIERGDDWKYRKALGFGRGLAHIARRHGIDAYIDSLVAVRDFVDRNHLRKLELSSDTRISDDSRRLILDIIPQIAEAAHLPYNIKRSIRSSLKLRVPLAAMGVVAGRASGGIPGATAGGILGGILQSLTEPAVRNINNKIDRAVSSFMVDGITDSVRGRLVRKYFFEPAIDINANFW